MLKTKKRKLVLVAIVMFSMVAMYGYVPKVSAAISSARDTISDSDINATGVAHAVQFTTSIGLAQTDYMQVTFPSGAGGFGNIVVGNVSCPPDTTESVNGNDVICTVDNGHTADPGTYVITITGMTNPNAEGAKTINIYTKASGGSSYEQTEAMVYIIDDVTVTAHVQANLTFSIDAVASGQTVNGDQTTVVTTATTIPFGSLTANNPAVAAQELTVSTNADDGFTVTVQQTDELTNAAGSNINSFNNALDNTGSTTPALWDSPKNQLGDTYTYGHMGLTSDDISLSGGDLFGGSLFAGLNNTNPMEVMYHDGPSDGATQNIGKTRVAYQVEIGSLQEAGDYSTTLTYICTPQY